MCLRPAARLTLPLGTKWSDNTTSCCFPLDDLSQSLTDLLKAAGGWIFPSPCLRRWMRIFFRDWLMCDREDDLSYGKCGLIFSQGATPWLKQPKLYPYQGPHHNKRVFFIFVHLECTCKQKYFLFIKRQMD